jgi:hypothetical protein
MKSKVVIEITMVPNTKYVCILLGRVYYWWNAGITSGWKWWQKAVKTKMSCNRWEGSTWAQEIFSFGFWGERSEGGGS